MFIYIIAQALIMHGSNIAIDSLRDICINVDNLHNPTKQMGWYLISHVFC